VFFFKYYDEYYAEARPEGRTIVFGGSWTFGGLSPAKHPKERARTTSVKSDKPVKLAQLRAAKRIWLNAAG